MNDSTERIERQRNIVNQARVDEASDDEASEDFCDNVDQDAVDFWGNRGNSDTLRKIAGKEFKI